jgi:hypothetical protein
MSQFYKEKTGKLIDTWIKLRRKIDNYQRSVTDYINIELSEEADLSGRQIERMRRYDGFPEDKSIIKLINAIPDLKSLDCSDFVERLLLPFSVVEQAQSRIKAPPQKGSKSNEILNTIVIISGWVPPLGINQNEIAQATTNNISGDFEYKFLYPDPQTYPEELGDGIFGLQGEAKNKEVETKTEGWINKFRQKCSGIKYSSEITNNDQSEEEGFSLLREFGEIARNRILSIHSNSSDSKFWFLLPSNYTVLYNPDKPKNSGFDRYGMFNVKGKLIEFPSLARLKDEEIDKNFSNSSSGWLYIEEEQFEDLAELYLKIHSRQSKKEHS